jgi:hypothetical protein
VETRQSIDIKLYRQPFEGIRNIIRFNWHFFLAGGLLIAILFAIAVLVSYPLSLFATSMACLVTFAILLSLVASWYIYDASGLYNMKWLEEVSGTNPIHVVNIHAGFDETSELLQAIYPNALVSVFDFYDPKKHTEISISRARKWKAPLRGTIAFDTSEVNQLPRNASWYCLFFAAHEIRNEDERVRFLSGIRELAGTNGRLLVMEHLRDLPNSLVYHLGVYHFYPESTWSRNFKDAGWHVEKKIKINPFIHLYVLSPNKHSS